jgi:hypothetical protein
LLGWGEITLSRYVDGNIPSKHYSNTLRRILENPDEMEEILENKKDRITLV